MKGSFRAAWPLLVLFAYLLLLTGPQFHAAFGMIDDHEIIALLGQKSRLSPGEAARQVRAKCFEGNGRFRPGYYLLRITETFLFGDRAAWWHASRFALACVTGAALFLTLRNHLRQFLALVVACIFFAGPQSEIWYQLGPGECYGMALAGVAVFLLNRRLSRGVWRPASLLPPFLLFLASGFIKESFIPLLPAFACFVYLVLPRLAPGSVPDDGRWRRADFLAALLLAVGVTVQVAGTLFMLHRFGHVYQEKGSLALVWQNGLETLSQCASDSLWHVPLLVAVPYLFVTGGRRAFSPRGPVVTSVGFLLAGFVLLLLPQWVIYGNAASCGVGRYLNPGSLFVVFALAVGLRLFVAQPADWKGFTVGLLLGAAFLPHLRTRGGRLRQDCARFARASVRFQDRLNAIAALTAQRPGAPVVFTVDDPRTYEPIFSVRGYLARLLGPRRRFHLRLVDGIPDETPLERKLRACLQNISQEGDSYFDRWASLPRPAPGLIEVSFTKAGAKPLSANAVRILE